MTSLVLRFAGPLQAWGSSSRFNNRDTERYPTRSGIIGMLAAARGMRRTESLEEFIPLRFGVRLDQPGRLIRDYQTVDTGKGNSKLSNRWYLEDAVFLVVIEGEAEFLTSLEEALRSPYYDIFLGRRACPPVGQISLGLSHDPLDSILKNHPWLASEKEQKRHSSSTVRLETIVDGDPTNPDAIAIKDVPVSFNLANRQHRWRYVNRGYVSVPNGYASSTADSHDPFSLL